MPKYRRVPKEPALLVAYVQELLEINQHLEGLLVRFGDHSRRCSYHATGICRCGLFTELRKLELLKQWLAHDESEKDKT